jgi:ribosome maturation factor RimP
LIYGVGVGKTAKEKSGKKPSEGKHAAAEKPADIVAKVSRIAEPLCEAEGIELVYVEYQRESGGRTLRLYIDRPGGVRLDDCVAVSRQLSDLLDVYLDQAVPYNLEISSPGPDRPLWKKADYDRFKGCRASIRTGEPIDGRKNFKGELLGSTAGLVRLRIDGNTVAIPFDRIKKARLVDHHGE